MHTHSIIQQFYQQFNLDKREIDLILCHVLNINTASLYIYSKPITTDEQREIVSCCEKRLNGMPLAYITGYQDFWTLRLRVNHHTLIPRAETELLVEWVLDKTLKTFTGSILDLGTGSGAIALSLASERPNATVVGVDFSPQCIEVAQYNKTHYAVNNVSFLLSDWFANINHKNFDIIVANPPYVGENDPHLAALSYEPITSLTAKNHGFADLFHIIEQAKKHLKKGGYLALEHGYNQHTEIQQHLIKHGYKNIATHNDLAKIPRITSAEF